MGQHKHNLTAQLAKAGMLLPKKVRHSKQEERELTMELVQIAISRVLRRTYGGV